MKSIILSLLVFVSLNLILWADDIDLNISTSTDQNGFSVKSSDGSTLMRVRGDGSVGIGTTTPNNASILDLSSTTKAFLPPRLTEIQKNAISSPATGMLIYQTNGDAGFYYYTGSAWVKIQSGTGSGVTSVTGTTPIASSGGATPNITIQQASGTQPGYLGSNDWTAFNNKINAVTGTSPISVSSGSSPNITIQQASPTQSGYISSTDYARLYSLNTYGEIAYNHGPGLPPSNGLYINQTYMNLGTGTTYINAFPCTGTGSSPFPYYTSVANGGLTVFTSGGLPNGFQVTNAGTYKISVSVSAAPYTQGENVYATIEYEIGKTTSGTDYIDGVGENVSFVLSVNRSDSRSASDVRSTGSCTGYMTLSAGDKIILGNRRLVGTETKVNIYAATFIIEKVN